MAQFDQPDRRVADIDAEDGINFSPELTGIGKYTGELAAWLVAQGHEVRVVTAPPYYPAWSVSAGYSGSRWQREEWQGVQV